MKFTCNGFKSVRAETFWDAAEIFAKRLSRRKRGKVEVISIITESPNWSSIVYKALIDGNNELFTVNRVSEPKQSL